MLGKLLKYEWKSVGKIMGIVNLAIVIISSIGCIMVNIGLFDSSIGPVIGSLLTIFYFLSLIGFNFFTLIYLYVRFYRNLFTAEGYLMHTLPVTPTQLFHSKLLVGYFWCIINSLLVLLSFFVLGFSVGSNAVVIETGGTTVSDAEQIMQFFQESGTAIALGDGTSMNISFHAMFGYTPFQFILLLILMYLISCFTSLLMGYVSVLLGQLMEKYKLAATIGFYFAIYLVTQFINSIALLLPNFRLVFSMAKIEDINMMVMADYFRMLFPTVIIAHIVIGLIFYIVSLLLMRRKVNLD